MRYFSSSIIGIVLMLSFANGSVAQERLKTIENQIPKNIPIKVEFKNEKSVNWVHDLEIVVTNTGTKPIYFLFLSLTLDVKADDGNVRGFALLFGNGDLYSTEAIRVENDPYIEPDASYTFKISKNSAIGWDMRKSLDNFVQPQKGFLRLGWINFGDGTGMKGGGSPFKKKISRSFF